MVLDGGTGTATAVGSAVNITLRLFQVIYELKAVGQQTQDLLDSTKHVYSTLESAKNLRRQKASSLSPAEKDWIDNVLIDSRRCLRNVAALVEPARADLQSAGRVGFLNRGLFVFRDSPKVTTNLARLNLAHQSLNAVMGVLCSKSITNIQYMAVEERWHLTSELQGSIQHELVSPPSYERDQFLHGRKFSRARFAATLPQQQTQAYLLSDDCERLRTNDPVFMLQDHAFIAELEAPDTKPVAFLEKDSGNTMTDDICESFPSLTAGQDLTKGLEVHQVVDTSICGHFEDHTYKGLTGDDLGNHQGNPPSNFHNHFGRSMVGSPVVPGMSNNHPGMTCSLDCSRPSTQQPNLQSFSRIPSITTPSEAPRTSPHYPMTDSKVGVVLESDNRILASHIPSRARSRGRAWLEWRNTQRM